MKYKLSTQAVDEKGFPQEYWEGQYVTVDELRKIHEYKKTAQNYLEYFVIEIAGVYSEVISFHCYLYVDDNNVVTHYPANVEKFLNKG